MDTDVCTSASTALNAFCSLDQHCMPKCGAKSHTPSVAAESSVGGLSELFISSHHCPQKRRASSGPLIQFQEKRRTIVPRKYTASSVQFVACIMSAASWMSRLHAGSVPR